MRVVLQAPAPAVSQAPRHPEVNQENEAALEPDNQILATPLDGGDPPALEAVDDVLEIHRTREPLVEDLDRSNHPAAQDRGELGPDGLDFGKLRHA